MTQVVRIDMLWDVPVKAFELGRPVILTHRMSWAGASWDGVAMPFKIELRGNTADVKLFDVDDVRCGERSLLNPKPLPALVFHPTTGPTVRLFLHHGTEISLTFTRRRGPPGLVPLGGVWVRAVACSSTFPNQDEIARWERETGDLR